MNSEILQKIILEIKKCNKSKDVPVAAILVDKNNKIVAVGKNNRERKKCILGHAEIKVINKIFKKTKSKNLAEYKMYVSLKPCLLCIAAIEQSHITEVHYFLENIKCDYWRFKTKINFLKKLMGQEF
ncbi:tRNA-specific adenosine deaminase [Spiroplasma clarkii]|uniref:deaminase n=1 Tax=Spiroplasma clarkii TaxID=2139 RepID=UPI000B56664E|nr:nucleoside deaminase [Spiroplasma clarkii]ARU90893.1 tRNA-specific adenosine deaminase [Spiroplasma clarkii]